MRSGQAPGAAGSGTGALRIAHLTATFPPYPGGAGNTAYRFALGQADRGHEVEVFTTPATGEPPDPGRAVVHRIQPLYQYGNAPLIPSLATLDGFDLVHLHYPFIFGAELVLAGRLRRARRRSALIVHYKNRLVAGGRRGALFAAYEHTVAPTLIRAADRVCILSAEHARSVPYLDRALRRTPERLVEIPNGVDTDRFSPGTNPKLRAKLGIPEDALAAVFVATLDRAHYFKRLEIAIEGLARIRPTGPASAAAGAGAEPEAGVGEDHQPPHLIVAGGGELLERFRRQAVASGVADRVHFLGPVAHEELAPVLRAADVILLTTEPPESFGIVLIEAMACGLPAIATDYPGVRAVIDPGTNGLVVPSADPGAVADALDSLIGLGPERRRQLGRAGREKAEREWAWPRLLDRMDEAYEQAVAVRRAKRRGT